MCLQLSWYVSTAAEQLNAKDIIVFSCSILSLNVFLVYMEEDRDYKLLHLGDVNSISMLTLCYRALFKRVDSAPQVGAKVLPLPWPLHTKHCPA